MKPGNEIVVTIEMETKSSKGNEDIEMVEIIADEI
jgi:hypothetical protein